ncbi:MAG: rhamnulokinase [Rhodothermaceae bacterium]|nr:rhamnulokinase [Rhodothermaceae bacterium]
MVAPTYLAFDLGASSSRAILGTLDGDRMDMEEIYRFTTPILEENGHLYWDIEGMWREIQAGFNEAITLTPTLCSVSVDSWAVDYVPIDAHGIPLRNPYCYRDRRTEGMFDVAFRTMPASRIYEHTGIQFLSFNTLYQLIAGEDEAVREGLDVYLTIADYFNYRFCGKPVIELSMASTTQMVDVYAKEWSGSVMDAFGINKANWPPIAQPGTWLGPVTERPSVMSIATCSHDTGSAIAAVPATDEEESWAYISCGTWSLMGVERKDALITKASREGGFTHEAGLDGTIRFLKNLSGLWVLQECVREWSEAERIDWGELEAEARQVASQGELIELDNPRFLPRGQMEERVRAYYQENGWRFPESRAQLVRTILESIAASYRRCLDELQKITGESIDRLYMVGGGTQNQLLCELTAQATGLPVTAGPVEATALGNLLIQARTLGHLPAGVTIREMAVKSSELRFYE